MDIMSTYFGLFPNLYTNIIMYVYMCDISKYTNIYIYIVIHIYNYIYIYDYV